MRTTNLQNRTTIFYINWLFLLQHRWSYFNYWNDDYYSQWYHQLFFTSTEIASTVLVIHLADSRNTVTPMKALFVVSIAIVHVFAGGWDQFFMNVIRGEGDSHQVRTSLSLFKSKSILIFCESVLIFINCDSW